MFNLTSSSPNNETFKKSALSNNFGTLVNLGSSFANTTSKIDRMLYKKEINSTKEEVPRFNNMEGLRNDINGGHNFDVASF